MSSSVDNRIVKMTLENKGFLANAKASIEGLLGLKSASDKLKGAVDMSSGTASLRGLASAASNVKMDNISKGAQESQSHFSALKTVAVGALLSIGSTAVTVGAQVIKGLTLTPAIEGFQQYSNKMKTLMTVNANTGESYKHINGALTDLNEYAMKTSYSFDDMTQNLGTFTAAGVGLKDSEVAIKGIGNLAAVSGSSTQQAAMAMYQLSQALAAGKVGLQDWNSVVNAGMGGKKFQDALRQTGKEMGKNVDESESFRNSLQTGWLTSDVLIKTLQKFANDKSMLKAATQAHTFGDVMGAVKDDMSTGWSLIWEGVFGGFETSTKLWTSLSSNITNGFMSWATSTASLLTKFGDLGGRQKVIDGFATAFKNLGSIVGSVAKGIGDAFPKLTANGLLGLAKNFDSFMHSLTPAKSTLSALRTIGTGVGSAFDILFKSVSFVARGFGTLLGTLSPVGSGFLQVAATIAKGVTWFDKNVMSANNLATAFKGIQGPANVVRSALDGVGKVLSTVFTALANVGKGVLSSIGPVFALIGSGMAKLSGAMTSGIANHGGGIFAALLGGMTAGAFVKMAMSISGGVEKVTNTIHDLGGITGTIDKVKTVLSNLGDSISAFTSLINVTQLAVIATSLIALAVAIKILSTVKAVDIAKGLEVLGLSLIGMYVFIKKVSTLASSTGQMFQAAMGITALANAILVVSLAVKILSTIDPVGMATALIGLAGSMVIMVAALTALSKINGHVLGTATGLTVLAAGMLILAGAIAVFGVMDFGSLVQGLLGLAVALAEVVVFVKLINGTGLNPGVSLGLIAVATGLTIMAGAIAIIGSLSLGTMIQGLAGIAVALLEIVAFSKMVNGAGTITSGAGLILLATGLGLLVAPIAALGAMSWQSLTQGLIGLGVALAEVGIASKLLSGAQLAEVGAGLIVLSAGLTMLVTPIAALGSMSITQLVTGILALGAALLVVGGVSAILGQFALQIAAFGAALLVVSTALAVAGAAVSLFGIGLAALASAGATGLQAITTAVTGFASALLTNAPTIGMAGAQMVVSFATAIATAVPQVVSAGMQLILGLLQGISSNIGQITTVAISIIINFVGAIAANLGQIIAAGVNLINSFADAIRANSATIVSAVLNVIEAVLEVLVQALVQVLSVLLGWIPGVDSALQSMGSSATDALRSAFNIDQVGSEKAQGFANGVNNGQGAASAAGAGLGNATLSGVTSNGDLTSVGGMLGTSYAAGVFSTTGNASSAGNGIKNSARSGATGSANDLGNMLGSTFNGGVNNQRGGASGAGNGLKNSARSGATGTANDIGNRLGSTFNSGVSSKQGGAHSAGNSLGNSAKQGMEIVSTFAAGAHMGNGLIQGINSTANAVMSAASSLAHRAASVIAKALDEHSPSRVTRQQGIYFGMGLAIGIRSQISEVENQATKMANASVQALSDLNDQMQSDWNPTITPVLDTSLLRGNLGQVSQQMLLPSGANTIKNIGDINVSIDASNATNGTEVLDAFRSQFRQVLQEEIRAI